MADDPDEPLLLVGVEAVLLAFIAVENHIPNSYSPSERYKKQKDQALDLLQWAVEESDMGTELIKLKAQLGYTRKGDGSITIGPIK